MNKPRIVFIVEKKYVFKCFYFKNIDSYTLKRTFVGYVAINSRSKKEALQIARHSLNHKIDVVELYAIKKIEKSINYSNPKIKEVVDKYGEIRESEVILDEKTI